MFSGAFLVSGVAAWQAKGDLEGHNLETITSHGVGAWSLQYLGGPSLTTRSCKVSSTMIRVPLRITLYDEQSVDPLSLR